MITLGCCSQNFGPLSLDAALRLIHDLGFRYADVSAGKPVGAQVDPLMAAAHPDETGTWIRATARRYGLQLSELMVLRLLIEGQRVYVNDPDPAIREAQLEQFRGLATCAAEAGFHSVMGIPGGPQERLTPEDSWSLTAEMLNAMQEICAARGLVFRIEAIPLRQGGLEGTLRLIREVPGMEYTLDYSHFIAAGIPQDQVEALHPFSGHLHARQGRRGVAQCPLTDGEIDFAPIIASLQRADWEGVMTLEYVDGNGSHPTGPNPVFENVVLAYQLEQMIGR